MESVTGRVNEMNSRALSPLLLEYDDNIKQLKQQIEAHNRSEEELKRQIEQLIEENRRLTAEKKLSVQRQIDLAGMMASTAAGRGGGGGSEQTVENLQRQLALAVQEKSSAVEMYKTALERLEQLERRLESTKINPRVQSLEQQAQDIKDQYMSTVSDMNTQTGQLYEELKRTKAELKVANIQVVELKTALEEVRNEMLIGKQQRTVKDSTATTAETKVRALTNQLDELQSQLSISQAQLMKVTNEKQSAEQRLAESQRRTVDEDTRTMQSSVRMRDSVQLLETAVLERDQAIVLEKQAQEEVGRLQGVINRLVDEAGVRTRQEVDNVKKQCNVNLTKLMEEMQRLELESSEKQAQLERALREKRAAEAELEKIYRDGMIEGRKETDEYNELTGRACAAERARDEALMKIEALNNQIRRSEIIDKQDKRRLELELESVKDRLGQTNSELERSTEERIQFSKSLEELKISSQKLRQEKDAAAREHSKQLWSLQHTLQLKEKEYEAKLQSLEDSHRQYSLQMKEMLAVQQKMSNKWKEECNVITQKLELKLNDSRIELSREKRRTEDLTKLLHDSRNKTMDTEQRMVQCMRNMQALEVRINSAEHRSGGYAEQALRNTKTTQGLSLTDARKHQQRQLEQSLKESIRSCNNGAHDESLGV